MSVLKWIFGLLKKVKRLIDWIGRFLGTVVSSVLAWLIAGVAFVVHQVANWFGDMVYNMFAQLEDVSVGRLPVSALADWLGRDLLALDVAWECVVIAIALWVASRVARLSGQFVRLVIDLL